MDFFSAARMAKVELALSPKCQLVLCSEVQLVRDAGSKYDGGTNPSL